MLLQIVDQLPWNRPAKGLVRSGRAVARIAQHAALVFHLDPNHRMLLAIHLADVPHQGGERQGVGIATCRAERAEDIQWLARRILDQGETALVRFYPIGRIGRFTVLPASEPQDDQSHVIVPGIVNQAINEREIELAFLGLRQIPGHDRQHRIEVHAGEPGPDRPHILPAGSAGIVQFAGEGQKRLVVDDQLGDAAPLFQCGMLCAVSRGAGLRCEKGGGEKGTANDRPKFHVRLLWGLNAREYQNHSRGLAIAETTGTTHC